MLARYAILRELGRGASGAVYAARDRGTGATVALKRIDPALSGKSGAGAVARFLKQARAARLLEHPNIVAIHDAAEIGGTVYIAMEMLEAKSLRQILDEGPLPVARAIQIARDIASGLAYAHLEGVLHGALKPSNVLVVASGAVKIGDFGTGQAGPGYVSPEQLRGEAIDHRSDIYSLGALLYEMLAHRPPLEGGSPPPSELNPNVPRAFDAIVLHMLAAQPSARTPGVPIVLRELQRLEEGLGLGSGASAVSEKPAPSEPRDPTTDGDGFDYQNAMAIMERESRRERTSGARPVKLAAFALAVIGLTIAVVTYFSGEWGTAAARVQEALAPAAEMKHEPAAAPVLPAPKPLPPKPPVAQPPPPPRVEKVMQPEAKIPEQHARGTARLVFAISPQGELYIDGKHRGATPPVTNLDLGPGMHRIEVRSGSRTPYLTYVMLAAGDVRRIRHDFDTRGAVHPPESPSWRASHRPSRPER